MARRVQRGVQTALEDSLRHVPVVILEGARAVGKTTLLGQLHEDGHIAEIVDLSDTTTREAAANDPAMFVRSLERPAAIDEAQLVDSLPVEVKRLTDELGQVGQFLLTGSARIGRGALGGSDPMAGRAARHCLRPLTQGERNDAPVDNLASVLEPPATQRRISRDRRLDERIVLGGLPTIPGVVSPPQPANARRQLLEGYVESVLHHDVIGQRVDRSRLLDAFRAIASNPAAILNVVKFGNDLDLARSTVLSYLDIFESAFLLERIPALGADARREVSSHPRLVPTDVALAAWAMQADTVERLEADRNRLGPLLHNLVSSELLSQLSWNGSGRLLHWRYRNFEVDLVVERHDRKLVGLEIKASTKVERKDAKSLEVFLRRVSRASHGIILYLGDRVVPVVDGVWAVPIPVLWETSEAAETPSSPLAAASGARPSDALSADSTRSTDDGEDTTEGARGSAGLSPSDAALFLSYVHDDDDVEGGRITDLGRDIAKRYSYLTGEELEVFIDQDDVQWGDEWEERISEELQRTTFLVAIVTPRFLRSQSCREEVEGFLTTASRAGETRWLLPILYQDLPPGDEDDPLARKLSSRQWVDWRELQYENRNSGAYRREVDKLARRLHEAANQIEARHDPVAEERAPTTTVLSPQADDTDLVTLLDRMERLGEELPGRAGRFRAELEATASAMVEGFEGLNAGARSASQVRASMHRVATSLAEPSERLARATSDLSAGTQELDELITALLAQTADPGSGQLGLEEIRRSIRESLPPTLGTDPDELKQVREIMTAMSRMSKDLRPATRIVERAITVTEDLEGMLARWHAAASDGGVR